MHASSQADANMLLTRPCTALHCVAALTLMALPSSCMHAASQVKLLIKAGANVLLKNRWGNMAIDDAKRVKATPVVELLEPLVTQV